MKIGKLKEILDLYDDEDEIIIKVHNEDVTYEILNAFYRGKVLELNVYQGKFEDIMYQLISYL